MANYYTIEQTASALGITEDEVKRMIQQRELHGYRSGAAWKLKAEDIDRLVQQRRSQDGPGEKPKADETGGDVLLSEVELGPSEAGASGTIIGMDAGRAASADSDVKLADEPAGGGGDDEKPVEGGAEAAPSEESGLALEEDLSLEQGSAEAASKTPSEAADDESTVDLSGKSLEDDELVLGGSGAGSDITIGGDSGISLIDPADSGLSLEEPLALSGGSGSESLELGEDDMLTLADDAESPAAAKSDEDFLLTPLTDAGDDEDSESGSQVIALDTEGDESATMIGGAAGASVAAMLEEDLAATPMLDLAGGAPGGLPLGSQGDALAQGAVTLPEAPYSAWNIVGLIFCAILLLFCLMMTYDLVRHIWSWDTPYTVNSSIMDWILEQFEGK